MKYSALHAAVLSVVITGLPCAATAVTLQADQTPFHSVRGLWVDRFDYSQNNSSIDTVFTNAASVGITDVFFQVRGRADAYYNSAYEVWNQSNPGGYDSLARAVQQAKLRGIRIHAWINAMPLWQTTTMPTNQNHLIHQHPEYWIRDSNNNPQPLNSSYVIVNPTMPEVQQHLYNVAADIASKYDIDGLQLDYIRLTNATSVSNPLTYPTDPATVARFQAIPGNAGKTPTSHIADYKLWVSGEIGKVVNATRQALKKYRPDAALTASVWRDATIGYNDYQQDWDLWVDQGLLDAALPMIYFKNDSRYNSNVTSAVNHRGNSGIFSGLGTYMQDDAATAYTYTTNQLTYARDQGANGVLLYDYGTLFSGSAAQNEVKRAVTDFFNANDTAPAANSLATFESGNGLFNSAITSSGSNQSVASGSTSRVSGEAADGTFSQQIVINKSAGAASFLARHLSGGGSQSSNTSFPSIGSVSFWLKTTTEDLQVALAVDDASTSTERTYFQNVIADGQWHRYEWFLNDAGTWAQIWSGLGQGKVDSLFTLDSVQFVGTAATNTVFFDGVTFDRSAVSRPQWGLNSDRNPLSPDTKWSNGANWTSGIPNGIGAEANFLRRPTGNQSVTVDAPVTVGSLTIDNSNRYTIAGTSTLTFDNGAATPASLNVVNRGGHTISAPVAFARSTDLQIDTGSSLTLSGSLSSVAGVTLTKSDRGTLVVTGTQNHGAGTTLNASGGLTRLNTNAGAAGARLAVNASGSGTTIEFAAPQALAGLSASGGAAVKLLAGGVNDLSTASLTITGPSQVDLANNDLTITNASASTPNEVRQYLLSSQLTSSTPDPGDLLSLGYRSTSATTLLVKLTYTGDANFDGTVNADDYVLLDRGFSRALTGWANGDFNHDGSITGQDYLAVDRVFVLQGAPMSTEFLAAREAQFGSAYVASLTAAVPEPSALGLLAAAASLIARRRRR